MKTLNALLFLVTAVASAAPEAATLRVAFADDFLIGVAFNRRSLAGGDSPLATLAAREFSSLTPENEMKWMALHSRPDRYDFAASDALVEFAAKNRMAFVGHTLVWHSQTPDWVFQGENGKPATREVLLGRMRSHIETVMGRYRGKIKGWDVVNEAISDGGPEGLRDSPWKRIIGEDFLDHAFRIAHETDPKAELYYNDYGLEDRRKRRHALALLKGLVERKVPIHGVGLQGHYHLSGPPASEVEQTIKDFAALGLKVMITEMDVDVLPSRGPVGNADIGRREKVDPALDPYREGLPEEIQQKLAQRYAELFDVFMKHRDKVTRVTFWGTDDGHTWLNYFPIAVRANHPLLFDRKLQPKAAYEAVFRRGASTTAPEAAPVGKPVKDGNP